MQMREIQHLNVILLSIFYINLMNKATMIVGNCMTPENASGICLALADCPYLYNMIQKDMLSDTEKLYLQQCQCGINDREEEFPKKVLVCCSQKESRNLKVNFNSNASSVVEEHGFSSENKITSDDETMTRAIDITNSPIFYTNCTTPENALGICISLTDCPYLHNMIVNNVSEKDITYLRQSQCGYNNKDSNENAAEKVLVCCSQRQLQNLSAYELAQRGDILPDTSECGFFLESKIYGGNETEIGEFPWMVMIEYRNLANNTISEHRCGGSLINARYVLTAAHCINDTAALQNNWEPSRVRLGEWDLNTDPDCHIFTNGFQDCTLPHRDIDIESTLVHEQYRSNSINHYHDIALIRLAEIVTYNMIVRPICLPLIEKLRFSEFKDSLMEVSGWGKTEHAPTSHIKLKTTVKVWSLGDCQMSYNTVHQVLNETQLCAGGELNIDSCRGDSGGPLSVKEKINNRNIHFLAGIVSNGPDPCGTKDWPAVYTRVGSYIDWIIANLKA